MKEEKLNVINKCLKCGKCCSNLIINKKYIDKRFKKHTTKKKYTDENNEFIRKFWNKISETDFYYGFECIVFDKIKNICTDYVNRPKICSNYPFYGDKYTKTHQEGCGYNINYEL